jgi:hypothetical protein
MPTVSRQQQKLMHGVASGNIPAGKGKPTKKVARDFVAADHNRGPKQLPQNVGAGITMGKPAKEMY